MIDNLIKRFHAERKANKNRWVFFHGEIDGQPVSIKSFNNWVQVATFNGFRDGSPMDCKVSQLDKWLRDFFESCKSEAAND